MWLPACPYISGWICVRFFNVGSSLSLFLCLCVYVCVFVCVCVCVCVWVSVCVCAWLVGCEVVWLCMVYCYLKKTWWKLNQMSIHSSIPHSKHRHGTANFGQSTKSTSQSLCVSLCDSVSMTMCLWVIPCVAVCLWVIPFVDVDVWLMRFFLSVSTRVCVGLTLCPWFWAVCEWMSLYVCQPW